MGRSPSDSWLMALACAHFGGACCAMGAGGADPRLEPACGLRACYGAFGRAAPGALSVRRAAVAAAAADAEVTPKLGLIFAGTLLGAVLSAEQSDTECGPKAPSPAHPSRLARRLAPCRTSPSSTSCWHSPTRTELRRGEGGGRHGGREGTGREEGSGGWLGGGEGSGEELEGAG